MSTNQPPAPKPKLTESQGKRAGQTAKAIFYSVIATLAIVLVVLAFNPMPDHDRGDGVDVASEAEGVAEVAEFTPVMLDLPEDWSANYARWYGGDDVNYWSVGYLTDTEEFFGFDQTANANPTWINSIIKNGEEQGTTEILDHEFSIYLAENNHHYLVGEIPSGDQDITLITNGSLPNEDLGEYTGELVKQIENADH